MIEYVIFIEIVKILTKINGMNRIFNLKIEVIDFQAA
jgi:hypothetical protein